MQRRWLIFSALSLPWSCWSVPGWAQQPKPGGTLRVALAGDMTFFNANQGPGARLLHLLGLEQHFQLAPHPHPTSRVKNCARTGQVVGCPGRR